MRGLTLALLFPSHFPCPPRPFSGLIAHGCLNMRLEDDL